MQPCILMWLALGVVSCARFPRYLPYRAVNVIFMHPALPNTSHSVPYRHSLRNFQNFFKFLDDFGFDNYDTVENSHQDVHLINKENFFNESETGEEKGSGALEKDPWIHFIVKGIAKINDSQMVHNKTRGFGNQTETATVVHLSKGVLSNDNYYSRFENTSDVVTSPHVDAYTVKTERNYSDGYIRSFDNSTNHGGERVKRIRREFNRTVVPNEKNSTQCKKMILRGFSNNSTNFNVPINTMSNTNETAATTINKTASNTNNEIENVKKTFDLTSSVLENKSQAILKRLKRVGDFVDAAKTSAGDKAPETSSVVALRTPDTAALKLAAKTSTPKNTSNLVIGNITQNIDIHEATTAISTTQNQSEAILDATSSLFVEPTKDNSHKPVIEAKPLTNLGYIFAPNITIDVSNQTENTEPTPEQPNTTGLPKPAHTTSINENKTTVQANKSITSDPPLGVHTASAIENKMTAVTAFKFDNSTETTSRSQEIFEVPDGIEEESSVDVDTSETIDKIDVTPNEKTGSDSDTDVVENERKRGSFRKMMGHHSPITVDSDIEDYYLRMEQVPNYNGDFVKALVVPVFLVVLIGSLLFAMNSMSRDFFIPRTNTRRVAATNPQRDVQMTFVSTTMETGTNETQAQTLNQNTIL